MSAAFWDTQKVDSSEKWGAVALKHFASLSSEETMQAIKLPPLNKLLQVSWALAIGSMHTLSPVHI